MAGAKDDGDLITLRSTARTTEALIEQLQAGLALTGSARKSNATDRQVNALDLAHDTASLIKAHSTKISLLIINKPFTATAITKVLRELVAGPLPGLGSAVELCNAAKYTKAVSQELQWRAKKVFTEFGTLVKAIPLDGEILTDDQKNGRGGATGKGSLASTGVVWEACESMMELKTLGVAGLVIRKAEQYRDLIKDAIEELQEWGEEESDEDDAEHSEEDGDSAQEAVDNLFGSQCHIPKDDPDKIRQRLDSSLKRLRLIVLMYQAVIKRRFKTLPALPHPDLPEELKKKSSEDPGIVSCVDEVLGAMKEIPDITDELANAFYELDTSEIDKLMEQCFFKGFAAVQLLVKDWEGHNDDFTVWATKFQVAMKKGW